MVVLDVPEDPARVAGGVDVAGLRPGFPFGGFEPGGYLTTVWSPLGLGAFVFMLLVMMGTVAGVPARTRYGDLTFAYQGVSSHPVGPPGLSPQISRLSSARYGHVP